MQRAAIISLFKVSDENGDQRHSQADIAKLLDINRSTVSRAVDRYEELGGLGDRPRSGRPRTVRTPEEIRSINRKVQRQPLRSSRELARQSNSGMSKSTAYRVLTEDLGLHAVVVSTTTYVRSMRSLKTRTTPSYI